MQPQVKAFYLVPRSSNAFVRTLVCHIRNELCAIDWTRREYGILLTFNDVVQQLAHLESLELRIDPTTGLVLSKLLGGPGSTLRNAAHAEIDLPTILPQLAHLHLSLGEVSASNPRARLPATRAEVLAGVLARWPSIKQLHLNRIPLGLARNHPTLPSIALEGLFISDDEPSTPTRPAVALLLATKGTLTSLSITCDDMMLLEVGDCLCQPGWTLRSLALTGRHVFNMPDTSRTRHPTNDVLEFVAPILPFHTGLRRLFIGPNNLPGSRGSSLRWTHALDCDDFWSALPLSVTELFIHCIVGSRPAGLLDYLDRAEGTRAALRSLEFQTVISMGHLEYRCEQLGIQLSELPRPGHSYSRLTRGICSFGRRS